MRMFIFVSFNMNSTRRSLLTPGFAYWYREQWSEIYYAEGVRILEDGVSRDGGSTFMIYGVK